MNDLETGTEHVAASYLWRANKLGQRVHILDSGTGRTFCQTENGGGKPLDGRGTKVPAGRRLCQNCANLASWDEADYREPDVRVLMGERIAEAEPELFAASRAPVPAMRRKQARPVSRSRGRKPKRSTAKYSRPFDDPLPS